MKVILDTNVFISGVFFSGPPYQILGAWRDGKIKLVPSVIFGLNNDKFAKTCRCKK